MLVDLVLIISDVKFLSDVSSCYFRDLGVVI